MRDWTKAMAALLAAVSSVGAVQMLSAQEAATTAVTAEDVDPFTTTTLPAAKNVESDLTTQVPAVTAVPAPQAAPKAVKADDVDPFSATTPPAPEQTGGSDLSKGELNVSDDGTVELHVSDVNLIDLLRTLSMQTKKNILTSKSVGGKVTANLYNVTFREALDAILLANGFAYREKGNFIYVYTVDELKKIEKDERKATTEIFKLNYTPAAVALEMITPVLSAESLTAVTKASAVGLPTGSTSDVGGNSHATEDALIVTDYSENLGEIRRILKEIDRRPQQILIEATIMSAELNDNNSLGVDFSLLGGVDFATIGTTNTAGLSANSTGVTASGANPPSPAELSENGYNAVGTNIKGANNQGLNIGLAYNNVGLFINALEKITDTVVLANPKVLTLNKQAGMVIVGRKDGYYTTTTTSTTTTQTVEYLETGTRLIFRPFISDDGFIRMEIHPEDSDGRVLNGLPFKLTTEVTSNVMVKDGHTIIIGGLFREGNSIGRSQVPLLGDIPLAGYLFRSQEDTSRRQEVIIMITPHIIKDHDMYSDASTEMLKYGEMVRVGLRKGMMPWSRDRLAEMSYQKARDEMSQTSYDRDRAMWYLDCATNLNPIFTEALAAKQRVSGELLMESDNSTMRHFVQNLVMEERAVGAPVVEPAYAPVVPLPPAPAPAPVTAPIDAVPQSAAPIVVPEPVVEPANTAVVSPLPEAEATAPQAE